MVRLCGLAGISGAALSIVLAVLTASKPRGCIGDECAVRTMGEAGVLDAVLFLLAGSFVAVALAGLVARAQRNGGRFGRSGRPGPTAIAAGAALLAAGMALDVWDFGLVPAFIIRGFLAVIAGLLLLGVAVLRAGALPRWAGVLLIVGALAMLGFNDQNWQALMAVPFGVAWVAVGYALWSSEPARRPARAR